jgi:hypothetical protein
MIGNDSVVVQVGCLCVGSKSGKVSEVIVHSGHSDNVSLERLLVSIWFAYQSSYVSRKGEIPREFSTVSHTK